VERTVDVDAVVTRLEQNTTERAAPVYLRVDNGPEPIAHAVADRCRFNDAGALSIDPRSPCQNAWIESFNGRIRDEHLTGQLSVSLLEAKVLTDFWRIDDNNNRRHRGTARSRDVRVNSLVGPGVGGAGTSASGSGAADWGTMAVRRPRRNGDSATLDRLDGLLCR